MSANRTKCLCFILMVLSACLPYNAKANITDDATCPPEEGENCLISVENMTACDRDICGSDKMCKEYHHIANNLQYHPYLKVRNVSSLSAQPSTTTIDYNVVQDSEFEDLDHRSPYIYNQNQCRVNFIGVNYRVHLVNESGFSPWEYVINRDTNRIPQDILETRCECIFCLLATRNGTNGYYYSRPMMVTRYFHMKNNGTTVFNAKFSYGCICEYNGPFTTPISATEN